MKRRKLIWHLYPSYLAILVVSTFFIVWLAISQFREFNITNTQHQLESRAKLLGHLLLEKWPLSRKEIGDFCVKYAAITLNRVTVVSSDGMLLNDSGKKDRALVDYRKRLEIRMALSGKIGRSERRSTTMGSKMVYVAVPVMKRGALLFVMRVAYAAAIVYSRGSRSRWRLFVWLLFVFAAGAMASYLTARWLTRPLREMRIRAGCIAEGDYSTRIKLSRYFEMAELARALNVMASKLEKRIDFISQERKRLGKKVEQHIEEKKRLKEYAEMDALTGVANRRKFDTRLTRDWERALNASEPISLILCDIDYFKNYNDKYGHLQGDRCLADVAAAIDAAVQRPDDFVARYGGEEFALILPNTPSRGALQVAEAVRRAVLGLRIKHEASQISAYVTASLGVCTIFPGDGRGQKELIGCADRALYDAKASGRNCVCIKG